MRQCSVKTPRSCCLQGGFVREDEEEDSEEDEDDVEEDTELDEEEGEDLPAPRETSVERTHRKFWDAKERLKTAVHIEHIKKYRDGLMSRDELAPTPDEIPTDSLQEESRDIILGGDYQLEMEVKGSLNSRMFLRGSWRTVIDDRTSGRHGEL